MYSISILKTNKFIEIDTNNISTLLYSISSLIRNRELDSKTKKDIPHIAGFGQVVWALILFINKVGWNKLIVSNYNMAFWQCVLAKFKSNKPKYNKIKKMNTNNKDKKTEISRIPPSIL